MVEPPCSEVQIEEMAGVLQDHLWGRAGLATTLQPHLVALAKDTRIGVSAHADAATVTAMGAGAPDAHLLGLFSNGGGQRPSIQVFCADVLATGYDPRDVLDHELGHRFRFDHDLYAARIPLLHDAETSAGRPEVACTGPHDAAGHPLGADALWLQSGAAGVGPRIDPISCPMCRVYARTAEACTLMEDLRERAMLAAEPAEVPLGLGGTIPLARLLLADAQLALPDVQEITKRSGEVRDLARLLHESQTALAGWLDSEGVARSVPVLRRTRSAAYELNHAYWLARVHPQDAKPRDWATVGAFR